MFSKLKDDCSQAQSYLAGARACLVVSFAFPLKRFCPLMGPPHYSSLSFFFPPLLLSFFFLAPPPADPLVRSLLLLSSCVPPLFLLLLAVRFSSSSVLTVLRYIMLHYSIMLHNVALCSVTPLCNIWCPPLLSPPCSLFLPFFF